MPIDPRRRLPRLALAAFAALALSSPVAFAATTTSTTTTTTSTTPSGTACGAATLGTVSSVIGMVAGNIYAGELAGGEVAQDEQRIAHSAALLRAVAAGDRHGAYRAVHALVYHSLWHIVRLRVLDTSGRILAEIGGPYVLAPVAGVLKQAGRVIGSYLMSVQDDYGFTLLEVHAAGMPISLYYRGKNVADTGGPLAGGPLPKNLPTTPTLTLAGSTFSVLRLTFKAFPTGSVTAVVLIPPPAASLAAQPCAAVRAIAIWRCAQLLAARFHPLDVSYAKFVSVVHDDTGATVILRIGPRALPGSEGLGPTAIPINGPVAYLGRSYWVESFAPTPPARIYIFVAVLPTAPPTGATGASGTSSAA